MAEKVKITGTVEHLSGDETRDGTAQSEVALCVEFPLRDLFAAFALAGLTANGIKPASERLYGLQAYALADAAIAAREGRE